MKQIGKLILVVVGVAFLVGCSSTYEKAWDADLDGKYTKAMGLYKKAIEQGEDHGRSEYRIGNLYAAGEGVPKNKTEALKWYRKAASKGNEYAMGNIGEYYEHGYGGLSASDTEAAKWYRRAGRSYSDELARVERRIAEKEAAERLRIVETLITSGGDVNERDADTNTMLHIGAKNNEVELVEKLIAADADVNIVNKHADTPLHLAARANAREAVSALLRAGANPYKPNLKNESAVAIAVETGDEDLVGEFVLAGVDTGTVADLSAQKARRDWEAEQEQKRQAEAKRLAEEARKRAKEQAEEAERLRREAANAQVWNETLNVLEQAVQTQLQIGNIKRANEQLTAAQRSAAAAERLAAAAEQRANTAALAQPAGTEQPAAPQQKSYSALAVAESSGGGWTTSWANERSMLVADNVALANCRSRNIPGCSIVHRWEGPGCVATAKGSNNNGAWATANSQSAAERAALNSCGSGCTVAESGCATW